MTIHPLATRFIAEIELLASRENCMLWAMNKSFTQEIFVSATFKTLWHQEICDMYKNQNAEELGKYLRSFTDEKTFSEMQKRPINPKYTVVYQIKLPDNKLRMIQDRSFHLNDTNGDCLLIAGVAIFISNDDLTNKNQKIISDRIDNISLEFYRLLLLPCNIKSKSSSSIIEHLTPQQRIVLKYILHGLKAKEIAKKMHLSFRTIEFHSNKIKEAFNANSKSELISIAIKENLINIRF